MRIGVSRNGSGGFRRHLSYANVMATVAVFIALGGTGYAMTQISGSQIKNRSIPAKKLAPHTLTAGQIKNGSLLGQDLAPHSVTSKQLRDLVVSSNRRRAQARIAQASNGSATIITLSVGESAAIVQSGPFTYTAECAANDNGQPTVTITAMSTEAGSLLQGAFDSSGHLLFPEPYQLTPGQPVVASGQPTTDEWDFLINGAHMLAPSGAALTVALNYGTNLFGGQCWADGYGID